MANFGFSALPGVYFAWLVVILLSYASLTQLVKTWFIRRYGYR